MEMMPYHDVASRELKVGTPAALRATPELGYLCADGLHRTGETAAALELANERI